MPEAPLSRLASPVAVSRPVFPTGPPGLREVEDAERGGLTHRMDGHFRTADVVLQIPGSRFRTNTCQNRGRHLSGHLLTF